MEGVAEALHVGCTRLDPPLDNYNVQVQRLKVASVEHLPPANGSCHQHRPVSSISHSQLGTTDYTAYSSDTDKERFNTSVLLLPYNEGTHHLGPCNFDATRALPVLQHGCQSQCMHACINTRYPLCSLPSSKAHTKGSGESTLYKEQVRIASYTCYADGTVHRYIDS